MKGLRWGVLAVGTAAVLAGFVAWAEEAAKEEAKDVTLKGEIVDLSCYLTKGAKGADHAKCAADCISKGAPAGLLAEDGTVTLLISKKVKLAGFAGKTVDVKGKCYEKGGLKGVVVEDIPGAKAGEAAAEEKKESATACACAAGCNCGHCKSGGQKACKCK